jgi:hypothetical protein
MTRRIVFGVLAAWLVVFTELVLVAAADGRIASVWELQFGAIWLAPVALGAAGLFGAAGAVLWAFAERARVQAARIALASAAGAYALTVAWGVGGGRHLAAFETRALFAASVGGAVGWAVYALAPRLALALERDPKRVVTATAVLVVGLELANRVLLVRLYPAFHAGLSAAALLAAPGLLAQFRGRPTSPLVRLGAVLLVAFSILAGLTARAAAERLSHFDNFRLVLVDQAPLLGQAVRVAAALAPPPAFAAERCIEGSTCEHAQLPGADQRLAVDLRGRDIVLITIDALRADHVGAYGYRRPTTPNFDRLAARGALFTHAYTQTPHTSYAVTSLMTGKYMRPLLMQGTGEDSDTFAGLLRTYGYRTAGFYPPAVFFIDQARFSGFARRFLDFEYRKVEFAEGDARLAQIRTYLAAEAADRRQFLWVHLFGPHEPYEKHAEHDFGDRDIDRYDSEVAAADATVGRILELVREKRPNAAVVVTADHGEEFGDHGGRYHGTTVYEEQVHVPLVIAAPGAIVPRSLTEPVQLVDLLPTVLAALDIPRPARVRGRDLGPLLAQRRPEGAGLAHAETDDQALLGQGTLRLVCERKLGACRLFDLGHDPKQREDVSSARPDDSSRMRAQLDELGASHGRYELGGLRAEGRGWPAAILRGATGDGAAAAETAELLDDADVTVRRKAAEVLFELAAERTAPALRLALARDEDADVRRWAALALTRLGQGAPLVQELLRSDDTHWRRFAALALAEGGDRRGQAELVAWWQDATSRDHARSRQLLSAFAKLRTRDAVYPLLQSLDDVRLRPYVAKTLAAIGDDAARGPLLQALAKERYQGARSDIARSLVELGAGPELAVPLVRFLGVPDPLPGGVELAERIGILEHLGGPDRAALAKLRKQSDLGVAVNVIVPRGGNGRGVRAILRAEAPTAPGEVTIGARLDRVRFDSKGQPVKRRNLPMIDTSTALRLKVPLGGIVEVAGVLPPALEAAPGRSVELVVFAERSVLVHSFVLVPLADELPPPAPEPWQPAGASSSDPG